MDMLATHHTHMESCTQAYVHNYVHTHIRNSLVNMLALGDFELSQLSCLDVHSDKNTDCCELESHTRQLISICK